MTVTREIFGELIHTNEMTIFWAFGNVREIPRLLVLLYVVYI